MSDKSLVGPVLLGAAVAGATGLCLYLLLSNQVRLMDYTPTRYLEFKFLLQVRLGIFPQGQDIKFWCLLPADVRISAGGRGTAISYFPKE